MASRRRKAVLEDLPPVAWSAEDEEAQRVAAEEPAKKTRRRVGIARKEVSIDPVCEISTASVPPPTEIVGLSQCEMYVTNLVALRKALLLKGDIQFDFMQIL
jgi:hypothetical protein